MGKYIYILLVLLIGEVKSQVLHHQSMGSQGNSILLKNSTVLQTIGQLSQIGNYKSNSVIVQQGFQQNFYVMENNPLNSIVCNVYPNPTKDYITISFDKNLKDPFTLFLSDISGRLISKWSNIDKKNYQISLKNLSEGTYVLIIEMNKRTFSKKIIKNNEK